MILGLLTVGSVIWYFATTRRSGDLQLIGTVDANEVIVSSKIPGRIQTLTVVEGQEVKAGELIAVHVAAAGAIPGPAVEANLALARGAGAEIVELEGGDCVPPVLRLAQERGITQIFVGHGAQPPRWAFWRRSVLDRLIGRVENADIRVFPHQPAAGAAHGGA